MPQPRILITSALPYINGVKHLGNLAGSMLPADVYARFQRARGAEVLCLCATDEHGTPAELAAAAAGQDVRAYCDEQHAIQREIGERFGLSWDWFGRSSSDQNRRLTQHFAAVLEDQGLVEERTDRMVYSVTDARFLPDRYVEGRCPICGYDHARGDQCDNCGSLLDPVDLLEPYSTISGSRDIEVRDTRHLYLLQTRMQDRIRAWVDARTEWQPLARSIALKHLDEGLIDRGITRDLSWGVPVHRDGAPRRGSRPRSSTSGSTPPSNTSPAPRSGRRAKGKGRAPGVAGGGWTRARGTSATSSSWARTMWPSTASASP
jgi:methionyl-tRNA synthetase